MKGGAALESRGSVVSLRLLDFMKHCQPFFFLNSNALTKKREEVKSEGRVTRYCCFVIWLRKVSLGILDFFLLIRVH